MQFAHQPDLGAADDQAGGAPRMHRRMLAALPGRPRASPSRASSVSTTPFRSKKPSGVASCAQPAARLHAGRSARAPSRRGSAGSAASGCGRKTRPTSKIATRSVKRRLARAVFSSAGSRVAAQVAAIGRERIEHGSRSGRVRSSTVTRGYEPGLVGDVHHRVGDDLRQPAPTRMSRTFSSPSSATLRRCGGSSSASSVGGSRS